MDLLSGSNMDGIELFMNKNNMSGGSNASAANMAIDVDDIVQLDDELGEMGGGGGGGGFSAAFESDLLMDKPSVQFDEMASVHDLDDDGGVGGGGGQYDMNMGGGMHDDIGSFAAHNTAATSGRTWDGYGHVNAGAGANMFGGASSGSSSGGGVSGGDEMREKMRLLRRLAKLEQRGHELNKKYTMESSLDEMRAEYEIIKEDEARRKFVKTVGYTLSSAIHKVECVNKEWDPFGIDLDGWSAAIEENMDELEDPLEELHEKWRGRFNPAPELQLAWAIGKSAMDVAITNRMLKNTNIPGADAVMKQNPALAREFQLAAMKLMEPQNPSFAGFMNNMMNTTPAASFPMSVPTQGEGAVPPPPTRGGNNPFPNGFMPQAPPSQVYRPPHPVQLQQRPNITMGRGAHAGQQQPMPMPAPAMNPQAATEAALRPEMKGPSDLSHILGGIRTRTAQVFTALPPQQQQQQQQQQSPANMTLQDMAANNNNSSTMSIDEARAMQSANAVPKRGRKKKAQANTISLDI